MNDSATNTMATVPIAKASGAAAPAACTTNVMLKAAVTVGQMTETDKPMASGRLKRFTKVAIHVLASISAHHEGRYVCVRHQASRHVGHDPIDASSRHARRSRRRLRAHRLLGSSPHRLIGSSAHRLLPPLR